MDILLIEDDNLIRRVLKRSAKALGHQVSGCSDAVCALRMFAENKYTVIMLDWVLPGMDGIELCRKIRSMPGGEKCYIIMLTGKTLHENLKQALKAGADDYITKPIDVRTLKTRLTIAENMIKKLDSIRKG